MVPLSLTCVNCLAFYHVISCILILIFMFAITNVFSTSALFFFRPDLSNASSLSNNDFLSCYFLYSHHYFHVCNHFVFSFSVLNICPFSTLFAFLLSFDKPASIRCQAAGQCGFVTDYDISYKREQLEFG